MVDARRGVLRRHRRSGVTGRRDQQRCADRARV